MTVWKVTVLKPKPGTKRQRYFRNSYDAALFCDTIPSSSYETPFICEPMLVPDEVVEAAEQRKQIREEPVILPFRSPEDVVEPACPHYQVNS